MSLRLTWAAASHAGRRRPGNEDAAVAEEGLFAVADGMGGHAGGEIASRLAIEALREVAHDGDLVAAVRAANEAVIERAAQDPALRGMGTTICAMTLVDGGSRAVIANVGDSRAYLFRDGDLVQVTEDHNLVAELEREGRLSHEEARVHPQRNIITRVLGNDRHVEVDQFPVDPYRGDRFLLCSDGLFSEVDDETIAGVLRRRADPQEAVDELVELALEGGGRDNITVVLADVLDDDDPARAASAALAGAAATAAGRAAPAAPRVPELDDTGVLPAVDGAPRQVDVEHDDGAGARRLTWRSALFVLAVLLVLGAAAGSIWWVARNSFYVGVDGEQVTIFRGKPGGVLWLDPTVEERTDLTIDDVPPARRMDVEDGREEPTLADARRYVANLEAMAEERRRTTTTTSTSTTSTTTPSSPPAPTVTSAP